MSTAQASLHRTQHSKSADIIAGRKFLFLFLYLLASVILFPFVEHNPLAYRIFRLGGSVGILYTVYAINVRRTVLVCGVLLAIPAVLHHLFQFQTSAGSLSILGTIASFIFDGFVAVVIFRRVIIETQPTSETIFGALSIYMFVGLVFASVYSMLATLQPKAFYFDPLLNVRTTPERFDFVYYSFATMTSLGATGITPLSDQARAISVIQTTIGVIYLAVLIAHLIGTYKHPPAERRD
jgi:hypothetical protein